MFLNGNSSQMQQEQGQLFDTIFHLRKKSEHGDAIGNAWTDFFILLCCKYLVC